MVPTNIIILKEDLRVFILLFWEMFLDLLACWFQVWIRMHYLDKAYQTQRQKQGREPVGEVRKCIGPLA